MSYSKILKDWYYQRKWFLRHPQPDGSHSIDEQYDEERSNQSISLASDRPMAHRVGTNMSLKRGDYYLRRPTNKVQLRKIPKGGRRVFVNLPLPKTERNAQGQPKQHYASNRIKTSKYSVLTFVPKNLFFQFTRLANVYFLGMAVLQMLPYFGINSPVLTLLPICSVLFISAVKDAFEDYQRHVLDHKFNTQSTYTLAGYHNVNYGTKTYTLWFRKSDPADVPKDLQGKFHHSYSQDVRVGDFLLLRNGDKVPSDCVLLASSDETGICYVETKDLDGETNLKPRQSMPETCHIQSGQECLDLHYYMESEAPHPNLYHFNGTLVILCKPHLDDEGGLDGRVSTSNWKERNKAPITIDNMLLRGHVIRNTRWVIASVMFTGVDTKIMLNSGETPSKRSEIEKEMNEEIFIAFICLVLLCLLCAVGNGITTASERRSLAAQTFNDVSGSPAYNGFITFWASLIIFQNIIPISLYVSIEFVKTMQAYFIYNDLDMYDDESGANCIPRSWNLSDDLGQVQYIFSDKTGTLTRNVMEFRKCTVQGKVYGDNGFSPESEGARGARLRQEREMEEVNGDIDLEKVSDPAAEEQQFLSRKNAIFEEYKILLQSLFEPKYSSLDIDKLTFADPEVFKDLSGDSNGDTSEKDRDDVDGKDMERLSITEESESDRRQKGVMQFFTAIALCHTAVVERIDKQGFVIDDTLMDEGEEGTGKPEPDIISHERGESKIPKSESKTSSMNDSMGSSNKSVTETDGDLSARPTPVNSASTRRSRFRHALRMHKLRITNRSSKLTHFRTDRRGSRGKEFDSVPGQKPRNVDTTVEEQLAYKSESPDESALVAAVKNIGFTFLKRRGNVLTADILGELYEYELLNVIEFNSTRKRMSVIIRRPDPWNDIILYCKGADNVIIERLNPGQQGDIEQLLKDIEDFSNEGLRTLVFGYKTLSDEEYDKWSERLRIASTATENRAEKIDQVNELVERDFTLLGATAIEDKLQYHVPDCIETLRDAGINVWVLTGDKVETAINIGYASNLLGKDSQLWILRGHDDSAEVLSNFEDMIDKMEREREEINAEYGKHSHRTSIRPPPEYAFVVDGLALKHLLETVESKARLLQVVLVCKSVVCCRVSPLQKALVVELVRRGQGSVTLAVGDGANDVSMIQAANIGVGIAGQEGAQASMSADYAIGQFRFLQKLLIVQGHWSYDRISEMILNFFYKNVIWVFGGLWYQIFCGFSANIFYDYSFLQLYNLVFTVAPTCVIGCTDQDITKQYFSRYPDTYDVGIHKKLYTKKRGALPLQNGLASSYLEFSCAVAITIITVANLEPGFNTRYWTWWQFFCIGLEIVLMVVWVIGYSSFPTSMQDIGFIVFGNANFWLAFVLSIIVSMAPRYLITYYHSWIRPNKIAMVRQIEKYEKRSSRK
ncbi:hypothetical protein BGW37DRAFT_559478 [Umbelopsis sp. PMI_123]|nr:hypothetical protein BGW37DRAFT_559478 [Umbelopsis sp. PMI_123]